MRRRRQSSARLFGDGADVTLHVGDALAELAKLPADSVDAVVSDPPHGILRSQPWDTLVAVEYWRAVFRVIKPGARLIAIGATQTYHRMVCTIEDAGFLVVDMAVWTFRTGRPPSVSHLKPAHAPILIARKPGRPAPINVDEARLPYVDERDREQTRRVDSLRADGQRRPGIFDSTIDRNALERAPFQPKIGGRHPSNVMMAEPIDPDIDKFFLVPKVRGTAEHPCAKPVRLLAQIIRAFAPAGGLVLDPFCGSGTTGVAALATGRRALLIERDPRYADMARANLDAARRGHFNMPKGIELPDRSVAVAEVEIEGTSAHEHLPPVVHERQSKDLAAPQLRTPGDIASLLGGGVVPRTLVRWARAGRIPASRVGRVGRQAHGASGRRFRQGHGATQSPGSWGQGRG